MDLLQSRKKTREALAEKSYIQKVLREESANIDKAMLENATSFSVDTMANRRFSVDDTTLIYKHEPKHRFIDMSKRNTKSGQIKKKNYAIHNRPVYGVFNNVIKRLHFGYTEETKQMMLQLQDQDL
jgi:phosphoribosyl-ATP pyrophosphohydrolase